MKVNVWWLSIYPKNGKTIQWWYYSKDLKRDLRNAYQILDDVAVAKSEGSDYELSHYGIFELSKMEDIAKESNGLLMNVD